MAKEHLNFLHKMVIKGSGPSMPLALCRIFRLETVLKFKPAEKSAGMFYVVFGVRNYNV
jgi:hypothetical protein